jgi:hypothetical protein
VPKIYDILAEILAHLVNTCVIPITYITSDGFNSMGESRCKKVVAIVFNGLV